MKDENIEPSMRVVVAFGAGGETPVCCLGKVTGPAENGRWWIDVYAGAEHPLPQMFRADEILGVASLAMTHGLPPLIP